MSEHRPPNHHPSDGLLLSHAAGSLCAGAALAVASHLELCPLCRERARLAEEIGGVMLDDAPALEMSDGALDSVLARLENGSEASGRPARGVASLPPALASLSTVLPQVLREALGELPEAAWRRLAPGVRQIDLSPCNRRGQGATRLLRLAPGVSVPHHGHSGLELTLVLAGSFSDEIGRFQHGDLAELVDDVVHQPIADSHEDCICLIATQAPLRFTGLMGRLVQPWVRL